MHTRRRETILSATLTEERSRLHRQDITRLEARIKELESSCGHCGELEAAWERAERAEALVKEWATWWSPENPAPVVPQMFKGFDDLVRRTIEAAESYRS